MSNYVRSDLSLRMLLENPELLEVPKVDEPLNKEKDSMTENNKYDIQSAFLVPSIWQETIPPEFLDLSSEVFDNIDVNAWLNEHPRTKEASIINNNVTDMEFSLQATHSHNLYQLQHQHYEVEFHDANACATQECVISSQVKQDVQDPGGSNESLVEKSKISLNRGKVGLPLKAIVGDDSFDPSKRSFSTDELKVAPILPKSRKNFVPSEKKDDHYWTRRLKNNTAARRSREAKRMKENQITLRTAYLEEENARLKNELLSITAERDNLKKRLMKYEHTTK